MNIDLVNDLKINNPIKFLEILPELLGGAFVEKLTNFGISRDIISAINAETNKTLDKKLHSSYNIKSVIVGGIIYIIGQHIATVNSSKITKEAINYGKSISV